MALYDLQCTSCEYEFESSHPMREPHPNCPKCESEVKQLFNTVPLCPDRYSPLAPRKGRGRGIGYKAKK